MSLSRGNSFWRDGESLRMLNTSFCAYQHVQYGVANTGDGNPRHIGRHSSDFFLYHRKHCFRPIIEHSGCEHLTMWRNFGTNYSTLRSHPILRQKPAIVGFARR